MSSTTDYTSLIAAYMDAEPAAPTIEGFNLAEPVTIGESICARYTHKTFRKGLHAIELCVETFFDSAHGQYDTSIGLMVMNPEYGGHTMNITADGGMGFFFADNQPLGSPYSHKDLIHYTRLIFEQINDGCLDVLNKVLDRVEQAARAEGLTD